MSADFLRVIAASPQDAAPRLIYSDWLEEQGQREEAHIHRGAASVLTIPIAHETWRSSWRKGFAPVLPPSGLRALHEALIVDDSRLLQGATTQPPPLMTVQDWPCEGADAIGWCAWRSGDLETVGEVEAGFARACFEADQLMGGPAACRHFLNFWDDTPRNELRAEFLPEVEWAIVWHQIQEFI